MSMQERAKSRHMLTVASATLFVACQTVATAIAAGWALGGLFNLGNIGEYVLMALFTVPALYLTLIYARKAAQAEAVAPY
ncbi:MAG TPA: hypothetical protein PLK13_20985 [Xanthobacteraceae bacterium]|uniref:hypothetical protein n=1 Tax=Roseixanthobacter finlandensis TaxID=3119922 RepID=UPI000BC91101|nr:MAG: hypothetical protein B7Y61_14165 [Rhizobiales bacterium 35-66-30]OZB06385.1 MAG: hypothetical protein B7X67_10485 [Rhizobiales bacterium 39-66-18]HQS11301.1 hypothetical protein [Xanthobacteraceae bacterium]HQS50060.1 hypothetical protein [Xanthobacteraceae bacterium]